MPTHSLLNYSHWRIVSPESSLLQVGADGYIAQVWTGTARTPNYYEGGRKERTFETAFLEYSGVRIKSGGTARRLTQPTIDQIALRTTRSAAQKNTTNTKPMNDPTSHTEKNTSMRVL